VGTALLLKLLLVFREFGPVFCFFGSSWFGVCRFVVVLVVGIWWLLLFAGGVVCVEDDLVGRFSRMKCGGV